MSYQYRGSRLLRASLLCAICISATSSPADARSDPQASAATARLGSRDAVRSIVNRSTWAPDQLAVKNIVYESLIKDNPTNVESADVSIEDTGDNNTKQLRVRLFTKDLNYFSSHIITVDKDTIRKPLQVRDSLSPVCDVRCIADRLDRLPCLNTEANYKAVFASPDLYPYGEGSNTVTDAITKAAEKAQANGVQVKKLEKVARVHRASDEATIDNYLGWLKCPDIEFFGSIAPVDEKTGEIALVDGNLPRNWYEGFEKFPLTGKIIFFNSAKVFNAAILESLKARDIRTFIAPIKEFPAGDADKAFFRCFWETGMTKRRLFGRQLFPSMNNVLRGCEGTSMQGVYSIGGDEGPIWAEDPAVPLFPGEIPSRP